MTLQNTIEYKMLLYIFHGIVCKFCHIEGWTSRSSWIPTTETEYDMSIKNQNVPNILTN